MHCVRLCKLACARPKVNIRLRSSCFLYRQSSKSRTEEESLNDLAQRTFHRIIDVRSAGTNANVLTWIIVGAFFGFALLAFVLLYPIYRFLKKEAARNKDE